MTPNTPIWVAGHRGLVGSAMVRALHARGYRNLLLKTHAELDLTREADVTAFVAQERPALVVLAAAKVGGIQANNTLRYDFIRQNLMIATNVIEACRTHDVTRLINLGSSCIYPREAPQPMTEESLLTSALEPTNEPYAIAKIAAVVMIESCNRQYGTDYLSLMPTNLYGPGDNYDLNGGHVLPSLMRKFHEAKIAGHAPVTIWGSGTPQREFLHSDDLAEAILFAAEHVRAADVPRALLNVGSGQEVTIRQLAEAIQKAVGHQGTLLWDASKPDGTPRKLQDTRRLDALGWKSRITLVEGLRRTYQDFLSEHCAR
jgi:GDP-L-fucose synthase